VALLILLAACAGPRAPQPLTPVPVAGSARDLRALTGTWAGEFSSSRTERHGRIAFSLQAGRDTARGNVVFTGPESPPGCTDPVASATRSPATAEIVLTLGQVNVSGGSIGGWLRPYRDPDIGCLVDTWFEGTVRGDTLAGMYFSHPADSLASVRLGNWWVARQR
jgi:hypothetical protein